MEKEIILETAIEHDAYTQIALNMYDVPLSDKSIVTIKNNIELPDEWNIGLIYGPSGSGKSTLLKQFGEVKNFEWDNKSIISNFTMVTPEQASELLYAVGLSTVPSWLRPFHCLSNGEQFRANLARSIAEENDLVLIDEFTSVVDRNVAKASSNAFQKFVRKNGKRAILASCHDDIIEWLNPDWVYNPVDGKTYYPRGYLCRPKIDIQIFRCKYEAWELFKQHHYLSNQLNKSAKCFLATWNGKVVAFCGVLAQPNGYFKNGWRESRMVVLPDYQGLGIGVKFSDYIGSLIKSEGGRYFSKTIHPAMIQYRLNSGSWKETSHSREVHYSDKTYNHWQPNLRYCYAFEYIGKEATKEEAQLFWEKC